MGSEWRELLFTEAVQVNPKVSLKRGQVYPFVDMKAVDPSWRNASESEYRIFKNGGARFMPYDTLMARITPCLENGKIARYIPKINGNGPAFGSTEFIVIRGREGVTNNDFAYYLTKWQEFRQFAIAQMTGSSGRQRVPADSLAGFSVPVPELDEQRAIDHILGSLDDKIELNRQMNRTLEKMAQAIFKSWFIDFDPVHAKAEGRDPGLPKEIADLFPDSFKDSELGPIPKGWEVKTLYDLFDLIGGGTPKTSVPEYWGGTIPWFSVVDAPSVSDVFVIDTEKHITELGVKESSTKILPSGTTIISARGTVGKCAVVGIPMAMNQSCYGIRGKNGIEDGFVYYTIREQVTDLQRSGHGSVFNTITRETFKSIRVPFASSQLTKAFENRITPFFDKIRYNLFESNTLISLRDTLIPQLISGKLRVSDAEKLVEDTV